MEETVSSSRILEEKIYVAVGKNVRKNISNLLWALQNSEGNKICILHIHQPSPMIPILGTRFEAWTADDELVRAYRDKETAKTDKILEEYLSICLKKGVHAEKLCYEMDSVEKGIVKMIQQHRIRKFVMGDAADKHCSMKMEDIKSKKANFVCQQAPATCQIQFTCKGTLIHTREARTDKVRALSALLSEFQQLEEASLNGQNGTESDKAMLGHVRKKKHITEHHHSLEVASEEPRGTKAWVLATFGKQETSGAKIRQSLSESPLHTLSQPGRSLSTVEEEPDVSFSQVLPCSGMMNILINTTKLWQKLTIQNHEHCE